MGGGIVKVSPNLQEIRQQASTTQVIKEEPETETWLNQEHAELDIDREIRNLSSRKARGGDGIPGATYKETRQRAIKPITKITNLIKDEQQIPQGWANGTIVYISKNK